MTEFITAMISVGVSALVTVLINLFAKMQERQKFYSEVISKDRLAWTERMRELSAEFLGLAELESRTDAQTARMLVVKNAMLVRLNPSDMHFENDDAARAILSGDTFGREEIAALRDIFPRIFAEQWRRAKVEAGKSAWDRASKANVEVKGKGKSDAE